MRSGRPREWVAIAMAAAALLLAVAGLAHGGQDDRPVTIDTARHLVLLQPIYFKIDRKRVRHAFRPALDRLAGFLKKHEEIRLVRISGHADPTGSPAWNAKLSLLRAEAVKAYLVAQGVEPDRLYPSGEGCEHPVIAEDVSEDGLARDRRVVFQILEIER